MIEPRADDLGLRTARCGESPGALIALGTTQRKHVRGRHRRPVLLRVTFAYVVPSKTEPRSVFVWRSSARSPGGGEGAGRRGLAEEGGGALGVERCRRAATHGAGLTLSLRWDHSTRAEREDRGTAAFSTSVFATRYSKPFYRIQLYRVWPKGESHVRTRRSDAFSQKLFSGGSEWSQKIVSLKNGSTERDPKA
eukprot:457000-Rhodomonas_salina.1